jgi:hypothetical protein
MTEPQDPFAPPPPGTGPSLSKEPAQNPYGAPPPAAPPYGEPAPYGAPAPYGSPLPGGQRRNGLGTAALVLGLVGLVPCFWFAFVPSALAVVFGVIGRGRVKRQEATNGGAALTGIVTGLISVLIGALFWGFVLANGDALTRYSDCADAHQGDSAATEQCGKDFVNDVFGTHIT